jgi:hypothetical protein
MNASYLDVASQLSPGCVGGKFAEQRNPPFNPGRNPPLIVSKVQGREKTLYPPFLTLSL